LKHSERRHSDIVSQGGQVLRKRTLVSFRRNHQGEIDGRNSPWRIHEVPKAVNLAEEREGYKAFIEREESGEIGRWITHIFRISGFQEVKSRSLCSETHEIAKGEVLR
jgi:hypothetical protein